MAVAKFINLARTRIRAAKIKSQTEIVTTYTAHAHLQKFHAYTGIRTPATRVMGKCSAAEPPSFLS